MQDDQHFTHSGFTGPPGSGKSTLLRILAQQLGFEITEWQPPVPTLWSEHSLQVGYNSIFRIQPETTECMADPALGAVLVTMAGLSRKDQCESKLALRRVVGK